MNVKNLEKSTELREFLKLDSVLNIYYTFLGKKFQMLTTLVAKKCLRTTLLLCELNPFTADLV